jgi:predicted transposase YbfD/YdcC
MVGLLHARLPELDLEAVADPRAREGRWSLPQILRAALVGLMAGCKGLREVEGLTGVLSVASRRQLKLKRRLADTTMRDALCEVALDDLRRALHRLIHAAWRRKALSPVGLPLSVVAMDGKVTMLPTLNQPFVQNRHPEEGLPYGLVRTMTCALVSAAGRPCLDAIPIPEDTNEVGHFQAAFGSLVETYGGLFDVVSYDAGGFSRANADAVVAAGKEYLFALKDEQRTMFRLAAELLATEPVVGHTEDRLDCTTTEVRSLKLLAADPCWSHGDGKGPSKSTWPHARAFLSVEFVRVKEGVEEERFERMYVTSLAPSRLNAGEWLELVRRHWAVENNNHHTLDAAFREDDRPWIEADANGMLVVLLLRRIAYTTLALFRAVTLRSTEGRATPWKALFAWVHDTLVASLPQHLMDLRVREVCAAAR